MKNMIYIGVIVACLVVAGAVFFLRGGSGSGPGAISDEELTWVTCLRCGANYEMSLKRFYEEQEEKAKASPTPLPTPLMKASFRDQQR
jgi:hypothetical protein